MLLGGKMKKIILLSLIIFIVPIVLAQDLELSIVSYSPETGSARLRIFNPTAINYNDLKYSVDNGEENLIVERFASKVAISIFPTIKPGKHTIKITSSNGLNFEQELQFGSAEADVLEQREQIKEINKKQLELFKQGVQKEIKEEQIEKQRNPYYVIAAILIAVAIATYYIIHKLKK